MTLVLDAGDPLETVIDGINDSLLCPAAVLQRNESGGIELICEPDTKRIISGSAAFFG